MRIAGYQANQTLHSTYYHAFQNKSIITITMTGATLTHPQYISNKNNEHITPAQLITPLTFGSCPRGSKTPTKSQCTHFNTMNNSAERSKEDDNASFCRNSALRHHGNQSPGFLWRHAHQASRPASDIDMLAYSKQAIRFQSTNHLWLQHPSLLTPIVTKSEISK